jgi:hypothetical protein
MNMPTQSTLTSPLGTPIYAPERDEHELYVSPSRAGRIVPLVVGGIGAAIIAGGAILYAAGVIGAPLLNATQEGPDPEPAWQPSPNYEQSLGAQALQNLGDIERREAAAHRTSPGSLLPKQPPAEQPGVTVSPPRKDESPNDPEIWEPPLKPKAPQGEKPPPKAADPQPTPPNGYAY